jgi:MFS family permease
LTPDRAIEMLNSPKLKLLVYVLINLIYNFNSMFVGAIPFLIDNPKFECKQPDGSYIKCSSTEACKAGPNFYRFDESRTYINIVTTLGIECDDGTKVSIMTLLAFGANWAGSFIFNVLGDKYGRLIISKIGFILAMTLYLGYLAPITLGLVYLYMLLFGFFNAYFLQAYILGVEFTTNETRDFYTVVAQAFDGLMGSFTVIVFVFTKNFRVFMASGFIFGLFIMLCMFLFVPESPRFYVA